MPIITRWRLLYLDEIHLTFLPSFKGLWQLESMHSKVMQITFNCQNSIVFNVRSEVMQITFNCQNSIVFNARDFLHVLCHVQGSEFREVNKRNVFR